MIVKRIDRNAAEHKGDHARNVALLVNYMKQPEKDSTYAEALLRYLQEEGTPVRGVERLLHLGARNFLCDGIEEQRAEMMATANAATSSPNPLTHWLLSWQEHERPKNAQIDEAATMFLDYLGLGEHQAIYAAHADTHNVHVHIAVNRYDPIACRMEQVHNNWDLKAAHRAVALIVHRQGWQAEKGAGYKVVGDRIVERSDAERGRSPDAVSLEQGAVNYEVRTGLKSAQRIAVEEAAPILLRAKTWAHLHFHLAEIGVEFLPMCSGALLRIGDQHVKVSSAHRECSFRKLTKRLGEYKPPMNNVSPLKRVPQRDVMPEAVGALEFQASREEAAKLKAGALVQASAVRDEALDNIEHRYRSDLAALSGLNDGGRSPQRSMLLALIKERKEHAEAAEQRRYKELCRRIREEQRQSNDLERWLRDQNAHYLADRWRNRNRLKEWVKGFSGAELGSCNIDEIDGFAVRKFAGVRLWSQTHQNIAFAEWPRQVELATQQDDAALLAAYRIAVGKFHRVTINGSDEFKERALKLVVAAGMAQSIANSELKVEVETLRLARRDASQRPSPSEDLKEQVTLERDDGDNVNIRIQLAVRSRDNGLR